MSRNQCIFALLLLSVQAAAQTPVPVVQNPVAGANQNIIQLPDTTTQRNPSSFSVNNEAGIRYVVSSFNWIPQRPNVGLTHGMQAILTLSPCPAGLVAPFTRIWIADGSKSEAVALSATNCELQGTDQDSITFTPANDHTANQYTLGSASQGIQEAINAANSVSTNFPNQLGKVIVPPGDYTALARISILGHKQYIDANGAVLTCTMADTCVFVGDSANVNATFDVTIDGLAVRAGLSGGRQTAIEDSGQHTTLRSIGTRSSLNSGTFFSVIQIDNDQSAVIEKFDPSLARDWAHCGTDWCSVAIYGPGPFSTNPGVLWVKDSEISAQGAFNGIDNQDANTLRVSDSIVQGYAQFGIRSAGSNNNVAATLDNVYMEVGNATNPLGLGTAGFISEGFISVMHSTAPAGALPQFASGPSSLQLYAYYIVVHSSIGISAPYLAGWAYQSPPITVKWPQPPAVNGGTLTYDLLRQTVSNLGGNTAAPYGMGSFKVTATVSCTNAICFAVDTGAATSSYMVTAPSTYAPALTFWPGSVILTGGADSGTTSGGEPRLYTDIVGPSTGIGLGGFVNSFGANVPTVFAQQCSGLSTWSSIWVSCPAGDSISSNYPQVGALLLQSGPVANEGFGGYKGRLNFLTPSNTSAATHLITLGDSNSAKTLATPGHRPTNDANDTWIGLDNPNAIPSSFQLAFGAPVSISSYIGNVGDNASFLERLQTGLKTFAVPVSSTVREGIAPFQVVSSTPVMHLTAQFSQGLSLTGTTGNIGGSPLNAGQCASGSVNVTGATTLMTAIASPSSNPLADSNHGLSIWAFVSAADTVTVEVCAILTTTPVSRTYNVRVSQ